MPKMTEQTKRAIRKLLDAGLKRSDFSVRTERIYRGVFNGKACYDYGDAIICVFNKKAAIKLAHEIAKQGFYVEIYIFKNGDLASPYISDSYKFSSKNGYVYVRDSREKDKNGFDIINQMSQKLLNELCNDI